MRKNNNYKFILLLIVACTVAGWSAGVSAAGEKSIAIGDTVPDFKAPDLSGKEQTLESLKGKNGTVLIFISVQCPVSNAYNERMETLAKDLSAKGINVVGINANATESVDAVRSHAAEHNFTFTIIKDHGNKIADQLGADHTPEVFFLGKDGKLVYHGPIDNQRNASMVTINYLRDAVDETLSGKPVTKPTALAFGCSIKRA